MDPYGHIYREDDTETREVLGRTTEEQLAEDKRRLAEEIEKQAEKTKAFATSIRSKPRR